MKGDVLLETRSSTALDPVDAFGVLGRASTIFDFLGALLNSARARKPAELTPTHQLALDVASRWVAHAVTPDPAFVKDYADALAVIARRQPSKKSSGGDSVAESQKKKKRRR